MYGNEGEVGEAIEASINKGTVKREDLFIATKLWNTFHKPQDVVKGCDKSLANLRVKQIGKFSYLISTRPVKNYNFFSMKSE